MKILILTNIPVPYRIPVYNVLAKNQDLDIEVAYMSAGEENRKWTLPEINYKYRILKKWKTLAKADGFNYIHLNRGAWQMLNEINPDVVHTTGFNPSHLIAWFWSRLKSKKHVAWTDGWLKSEENLTVLHKILRKLIYQNSEAFVGASIGSLELFQSYGARPDRLFQSQLVIDNTKFSEACKPFEDRKFDLVFSGTLTKRKNPEFVVEVTKLLKNKKPDISVLILGKGELRKTLESELKEADIHCEFAGHVDQSEIPELMGSAKIHLFPTLLDAWGIVINEAGAAGTPTICSPNTAAVEELVISGETGWCLNLEESLWANKILELLEDPSLWKHMSKKVMNLVSKKYTFETAANGAIEASKKAML